MHSQSSFESSPHPPVGNADAASKSLLEAQEKARALFERRHWRKRIAQALKNTMLTYYDQPPDRRIAARIGG
jgi:isocitrate dehydrogenase kinase/phosphatase